MECLYPRTADVRVTLATLPPELLGEIFVQCSAQNPDSPLLLRQVSKSFQDVVYSTPRAWEHLTLHCNENNTVASSDKTRLWFKHSGSCLVNVRLEIDQDTSKCFMGGACCPPPSPNETLSSTLSTHVDRIRTLDILAPSETEARNLLNALYTNPPQCTSPATQSLSIRISSSTPPNLRLSSLSAQFPRLPSLQRLTLTNHTISFLSSGADLENLRELAISCPIRFPPIGVGSIVDILRRSPVLESLSIESRVVDEPLASPSQIPSPSNSTGSTDEAQGTGGSSLSLPIDNSNTPTATAGDSPPNPLVHLPFLTFLSLRTNAIPPILAQLLLPNLSRLHIEDLNGRRRGASRETAGVLRQLLVRMELPNEYRRGEGLKALELVGVDVTTQNSGMNPSSNVPQEIGNPHADDANATWAWCFKRMVALEELAVRKTDVGPVLELLAAPAVHSPIEPRPPQAPFPVATSQRLGGVDADAVVCPRLHRCSLTSTTTSTAGGSQAVTTLVDRFKDARPDVDLNVERVQDPFFQSLATGPVDFLSLYCDSPRAGPALEKGATKAGTRRTGTRPPFGPWVVLGLSGAPVSA